MAKFSAKGEKRCVGQSVMISFYFFLQKLSFQGNEERGEKKRRQESEEAKWNHATQFFQFQTYFTGSSVSQTPSKMKEQQQAYD